MKGKLTWTDFIPAFSGFIGKVALASSFALVWAQGYQITDEAFVLQNVRIEILVGSLITLFVAIFFRNIAPAGTLSALIILIPSMIRFGVHPLILSLSIGILGFIVVRFGLFEKLLRLSGQVTKSSLALVVGISGVIMCIQKLQQFFREQPKILWILIVLLTGVYLVLWYYHKLWLCIPVIGILSFFIPLLFGVKFEMIQNMSWGFDTPTVWWKEKWGIGYGFDFETILRTLPFAVFAILLWAIDTVSIQAIQEANAAKESENVEFDIRASFTVISIRNMLGAFFGGAQTAALWRSFLIPLFMLQSSLRIASILLGILGIIAALTIVPIQVCSFPPLVWMVLFYGIFIPFIQVGLQGFKKENRNRDRGIMMVGVLIGMIGSPIFTWVLTIGYEKISRLIRKSRRY